MRLCVAVHGFFLPSMLDFHLSHSLWVCLLAVPVLIKQALKDMEKEEGDTVTLRCVFTKPDVPVAWKKGAAVLQTSEKYKMKREGCVAELVIHSAEPEDAGSYSCSAGEQQSTAQIKIHGRVDKARFILLSLVVPLCACRLRVLAC